MACDIPYLLHRAEIEAVRAIGCDSDRVAAVHQEMCLLYSEEAIAGLLVTALDPVRGVRVVASPRQAAGGPAPAG